jgi:hypothetical protein
MLPDGKQAVCSMASKLSARWKASCLLDGQQAVSCVEKKLSAARDFRTIITRFKGIYDVETMRENAELFLSSFYLSLPCTPSLLRSFCKVQIHLKRPAHEFDMSLT